MSDLVITSRPVLIEVLTAVEPYVIFKRRQVSEALRILGRIRRGLSQEEFLEIAHQVDAFSALNHSKSKRVFAADVEKHLRSKGLLAPVTTCSISHRADDVSNTSITDVVTRQPLERG
jgi:hypothetical protein